MEKYIVTSSGGKTIRNYKNEIIGETEKRIACYAKSIGKGRIYRRSFDDIGSDFNFLVFGNIKKAKDCADLLNDGTGDDFKTELYNS